MKDNKATKVILFSFCILNQALFVHSPQLPLSEYVPPSSMFEQAQCNVSADFSSSCFSLYIWSLISKKNPIGKLLSLKTISSHLLSLKNGFFN